MESTLKVYATLVLHYIYQKSQRYGLFKVDN